MSQLDPIDHIAIYPSIGVARLGNSILENENEGWFYASEIPGKVNTPPGGYKDIHGDIKRQAARFRVYAFDSSNNVLGELNEASGYTIEWTVNLANKKGATYCFQDRYQHDSDPQNLPNLRNDKIQRDCKPDQRTDLIIDSGRITICGSEQRAIPLSGKFKASASEATKVYLGEIFTDREGRLGVRAGRGKSDCVIKEDYDKLRGFDNENWYDDISDGSISAVVVNKSSGKRIPSERDSWVLGAPPKYGSVMSPPVSLYDVIENVNYQQLHGEEDSHIAEVQYYRDIEPLLRRPVLLSWVNSTANEGHGVGRPGNFLNNQFWLNYLSNPHLKGEDAENAKIYRWSIFSRLRFPEIKANEIARKGQASKYFMPRLSGDGGGTTPGDPKTFSSLTYVQYIRMKRWADGNFKNDELPTYTSIEKFPIKDQPDNLTRAALEWCIGSSLHPGIEVSYNVETPKIFDDPGEFNGAFRFAPDIKPGDLTMMMAVPWQSDFYNCNDLWWPSARPDSVVEEKEYERVIARYPEEVAAHLNRVDWVRGFRDDYSLGALDMVKYWSQLGFIVPIPLEGQDPIFVEKQRAGIPPITPSINNIDGLREHLKLAMRIELSTIPLYLFAMYSIKEPGTDDTAAKSAREAKYILRSIASEEMLHLSLAGNLLLAIGGTPLLYDSTIIPIYPSALINRVPDLELHLRPATKKNLQTFIDIELPEENHAPPEGDKYETIGQFYKAIKEGFESLQGESGLFANARTDCQFNSINGDYAPKVPDAGGLVVVYDIHSALKAIETIVAEGEGAGSIYDDPRHLERCHYERFKYLKNGHLNWDVYDLPTDPKTAQYTDPKIAKVSDIFNMAYCYLLKTIEKLWTVDDPTTRQKILYGAMYGTMTGVMGPIAEFLCQKNAAPCFEYYNFDQTTDPVKAMSNKMETILSSLNADPDLDTLSSIKTGIDNLYSWEE